MRKIAIMMRIKLNGEALNNEGSVGNVMRPRTIELMDGVRNAIHTFSSKESCSTTSVVSVCATSVIAKKRDSTRIINFFIL